MISPVSSLPLDRQLRQEILFARERVYRFGEPTPLERFVLPQQEIEVWVKREDRCAVNSYKWRGACNCMAALSPEEATRGVVTASAGNHAQGVALAAAALGIRTRVHMPRSTPQVKQDAVARHGAGWVEIRLAGDSYDDAVQSARADEKEHGSVYVHAYDDLLVMAGQGTLADEVVLSGQGPFDAAFLQIGGGGMASGVSTWLKLYWPEIELIGVEGEGQASMKAAFAAGAPVNLESVDLFCDGTAVRKAGTLPCQILRDTLSEIETVSNEEVSHAIRVFWDRLRCLPEPSGALGLAAALKQAERWRGKRVLTVVSGANIDFLQLGLIAQSQGAASQATRTLRVQIPEHPGTMLRLLDSAFRDLNIVDFQYGKTDQSEAWPIFTLTSADASALAQLPERLNVGGYAWQDLTGAVDVTFRAIPLRDDFLSYPSFLRLDFYERPGALHDFLARYVGQAANLCYFNYRHTGERIGRALIGLDFASAANRDTLLKDIPQRGEGYRLCEPVDAETQRRLTGR